MKKQLLRLSLAIDRVIDTEKILAEWPPSLRTIFDNARCYTVIAFLWFGCKLLAKDTGAFAHIAFYCLFGVTILMLGMVALQSALILLVAAASLVGLVLPLRLTARLRRTLRGNGLTAKLLTILVLAIVITISMIFASALLGALSRAGIV